MKLKAVVVCAAVGLISTQVFAAASTDTDVQQQLNAVLAKQKSLQQQVTVLQAKLKDLNSEVSSAKPAAPAKENYTNNPALSRAIAAYSRVSFGSYLDKNFQYNGSDLLINAPSILQDEAMLSSRYQTDMLAKKDGYSEDDTPHMILSGIVESQASYNKPYTGSHSSNLDLTDAELDAYVMMSKWVSGLMNFAYNNGIEQYEGVNQSRSSAANSRVYINKAFVTFGNFAYSPWFASLGQMYMPFGRYSSAMVGKPMTRLLFRTKARAFEAGYHQANNGPYGEAFVFRGDAGVGSSSNVNNGGADAGYQFSQGMLSLDVGASYINNIANADGMQDNGNTNDANFRGFGFGTDTLAHRVPGVDVHTTFGVGNFDFLAEYTTATTEFSQADATYNAHGAKPSAYNLEGVYTFQTGNMPSSFALGMGGTSQALAFALPKTTYAATYNLSIWEDTVLSFEARRNKNYDSGTTATGYGNSAVISSNDLGRYNNVFTTQLDVYF